MTIKEILAIYKIFKFFYSTGSILTSITQAINKEILALCASEVARNNEEIKKIEDAIPNQFLRHVKYTYKVAGHEIPAGIPKNPEGIAEFIMRENIEAVVRKYLPATHILAQLLKDFYRLRHVFNILDRYDKAYDDNIKELFNNFITSSQIDSSKTPHEIVEDIWLYFTKEHKYLQFPAKTIRHLVPIMMSKKLVFYGDGRYIIEGINLAEGTVLVNGKWVDATNFTK